MAIDFFIISVSSMVIKVFHFFLGQFFLIFLVHNIHTEK